MMHSFIKAPDSAAHPGRPMLLLLMCNTLSDLVMEIPFDNNPAPSSSSLLWLIFNSSKEAIMSDIATASWAIMSLFSISSTLIVVVAVTALDIYILHLCNFIPAQF